MKHWIKRIGAVLLTLAMFATMLPAVYAANALTTSVTGLTASWEYSSHATGSGSATWTSGGTSISATSKGAAAKTNISDLTLANNSGAEAVLSFNYTLTTGGTTAATRASLTGAIAVSNQASASGVFSQTLAAGESITIQLKSPRGAAYTATFAITDLALVGLHVADPILTFKPAIEGGSYTLDGAAVTAEVVKEVAIRTELQLSATAEDGYVFYGWYDAKVAKYLSQEANFKLVASADAEIYPVFLSDDVALFGVGAAKFDNLTEAGAAAAASNTDKTVILLNDGTITGDHVIPAGVTLLIPYNDANTAHGAVPVCTSSDGNQVKWAEPYAYRTLTLAADATITVNGALEVGGRHAAAGGSADMYAAPTDALGYIYMTAGSHIEVNGDLYCWGYIYGDGTVTANNGAGIYEVFQVLDFRGGMATLALAGDLQVFPMTQYYVQNVEVATTYHYGATAYVTTTMFVSSQCITAPPIKFIGAGAMFQPGEGSYIVKEYDPATDTLNLDAYGDCALSTMKVELAQNSVDTTNFVLPITNNININIHEGTATLLQDIAMLPGSSLTVGQNAVLQIGNTDTPTAVMGAGYNLIVYDSENWTSGLNLNTAEYEEGLAFVHPGNLLTPVKYSPSEHKLRTNADIKDVVFDINGVVVADGFLYSTVIWADPINEDFSIVSGGAKVISSEGTGVVALNSGSGADLLTYQFDQVKDDANKAAYVPDPEDPDAPQVAPTLYYGIPLASIQLQNGNGSLLDTTGAEPGAMFTYCQKHDHWIAGEECNLPDTVEITFVVNGEQMTVEIPYGQKIAYPGETPSKALDNNYHYNFLGWSDSENGTVIDLPAAESATTYYAVFETVEHSYGTAAEASKHACECGKKASCYDSDNDGDHLCDLGCGDVKSEHEGGTASCDELAVCSECGEGYGALKPHTAGAEADCENAQTCTVCGAELNAALGHSYVGVETIAPTCSEAGVMTYTCSVCGDSYTEEIAATGAHEYNYACDKYCKNCGEKTNPTAKCSRVYHEATPAVSCIEYGTKAYYQCEYCGVVSLDANGIRQTNLMSIRVAGDCVSDAEHACQDGNCINCGLPVSAEADHEYFYPCDPVCMVCYEVTNPDATHTIVAVEAVEATCAVNGNIAYWYCSDCGSVWADEALTQVTNRFSVVVPATSEHTYDDEYDVDCNVCGDVREIEAPGEIIYGDADGNGKIEVLDAALVQQYLAGYDVTLNEAAADADGNGKIEVLDAALVQQYLAGYDVTLGPVEE